MQPVEAQKGVYSKSQLFDSLKVYLNNQKRLQPIIGLGSITECVKADTHNREVFYLCEVCVCRLSKADMRNHIMGSLHRYNYIRAWHPHLLSDWKEKSDLSKLAWPLMEIAKILEGKEGPGEVQCLEVGDALFQKMATLSENDAVTLITILRDEQGQGEPRSPSETTSVQLEHNPIQSQRTVLLSQNQHRQCQKSPKTSAETSRSEAFIKSDGWLTNTSPEPSMLPENLSFLDCYTGTKPLVGLCRMLECRSEDGHTCCFLCHCCRIRANKKDIMDHLTRSSHLMNYLMEIHPEQVEVIMADINDNCQLLQSLAKKVEQEEGRGEVQVVKAPESLCSLLTGKSYHWCIKVLCNGWTSTNTQKQKIAIKGPSLNKTSNEGRPEECAVVLSQLPKRMLKRKSRKASNTVFNVSLPLNKGSLLLERTSFSMDSLPVSTAYSPPSDSDLIPLPESQPEDCELDYDTGSFTNEQAENASQLQKNLYSGDSDVGGNMEPEKNTTFAPYQEDGCSNSNTYFNQSEDTAGAKYQKVDGENNFYGQYSPQERSSVGFYKEWQNKGSQTQNEWLSPAVSHPQDWSSSNSSYGHGAGYTEQWYNSGSQSEVVTRGQNGMSSDAAQQYYQQPQNYHMTQGPSSLQTGSVGQHGVYGEVAAHSDAARINMYPYFNPPAHSDGVKVEPRVQFPVLDQRQMQTYMEFTIGNFQTASQSHMTQAMAHQDIQGHGTMSNPNYNTGPVTNHEQHFPHPVSVWNGGSGGGGSGSYGWVSGHGGGGGYGYGYGCGGGGMSQSNAFIPSGQAPR